LGRPGTRQFAFDAVVCGKGKSPSARAGRPAAQAMPGRCYGNWRRPCSPPTFRRAVVLGGVALRTTGRRTPTNRLGTGGILAPGARPSYRRVLSEADWSSLRLAAAWTRLGGVRCGPAGILHFVGGDTGDEQPGKKASGQARHRNPVRSSHSSTTQRSGHQGVVGPTCIRFPWARRALL
jgi:hypothetical protein